MKKAIKLEIYGICGLRTLLESKQDVSGLYVGRDGNTYYFEGEGGIPAGYYLNRSLIAILENPNFKNAILQGLPEDKKIQDSIRELFIEPILKIYFCNPMILSSGASFDVGCINKLLELPVPIDPLIRVPFDRNTIYANHMLQNVILIYAGMDQDFKKELGAVLGSNFGELAPQRVIQREPIDYAFVGIVTAPIALTILMMVSSYWFFGLIVKGYYNHIYGLDDVIACSTLFLFGVPATFAAYALCIGECRGRRVIDNAETQPLLSQPPLSPIRYIQNNVELDSRIAKIVALEDVRLKQGGNNVEVVVDSLPASSKQVGDNAIEVAVDLPSQPQLTEVVTSLSNVSQTMFGASNGQTSPNAQNPTVLKEENIEQVGTSHSINR